MRFKRSAIATIKSSTGAAITIAATVTITATTTIATNPHYGFWLAVYRQHSASVACALIQSQQPSQDIIVAQIYRPAASRCDRVIKIEIAVGVIAVGARQPYQVLVVQVRQDTFPQFSGMFPPWNQPIRSS